MKNKKTFIKIITSILIVITLFNFIIPNYTFASKADEGDERVNEISKGVSGKLVDVVLDALKSAILAVPRAMRSINYSLASAAGTQGNATKNEISPFDIFFNRFPLLDANIFSTTDRDGKPLPQDSFVYKVRTSSAVWYYAIRTVAIAVVSIMLIWNITAALSKSTSAAQKVAAKNAIVDWVLSFALIMFMHMIVILVLNLNDLFLKAIDDFTLESNTSEFFDALENAVFSNNFILGVAALIVYFILNWQTFKYILIYIQRLLTIVLLVMISPLVPVTYSFDRMRGGRGQALNGWLRELLYNVFIQVLHALVYSALVSVAMNSLTAKSITSVGDLSLAVIAIASMLFVKYAERMVKAIFGFDNSEILNTNVIMNTVSTVGNFTRSAAVGISRMASGQSPIGFGQNLDRQNASSANGTSVFGKVGQTITNAFGGGVKSSNQAIRNTSSTGGILTSSQTGSSPALEDSGANSESGQTDILDENGEVIASGGYSIADEQQDKKLRKLNYDENRNRQDVNRRFEEQEDSKRRLLDEMVRNINESSKKQIEEEKNKKENTEENKKITEEQTITENQEDDDYTPKYGGLSPELEATVKNTLNAIKTHNTEKLDNITKELAQGLENLKNRIGEKRASQIEDEVNKNWNNPEELARYLKNLTDPYEREYAEKFAMFGATMGEDSDNEKAVRTVGDAISMSHEEADNKDGNDTDKRNNKEENRDNVAVNKENLSKSDFQAPSVVSGVSKVQEEIIKASKDEMEKEKAPKAEITPDFEINKIKDENLKEAMVELSKIDPIKYRINGKSETEIENDIEEEFEATLKEFTKENGEEPKNLAEIFKNMNKKARNQYSDYKAGKISPNQLTGDAKALATLEIQARRLNYKMEVGKFSSESGSPVEIQFNADGGDVKTVTGKSTSEATKKVLADLQNRANTNVENNNNVISFNQNQNQDNNRKNA